MNTNNESNTMKKTFKPIRIQLYSDEFGFKSNFGMRLEISTRAAIREVVKYLIENGYDAMLVTEGDKDIDVSVSNVMWFDYEPLSATNLTRLMGYAA